MDECWKQALRDNLHELQSGLLVENILPSYRSYLTDIEYSRVEIKPGNVAQVDELVTIMLTKENRDFDEFCRCCERNGYPHWAKQLRAAAGGDPKETEAFDDKDLMDEKDCFYYVDIVEVDDAFHGGLLKSIKAFVLDSSYMQFVGFRREAERVIRRSQHVTACKVHLSYNRMIFLHEMEALWVSSLEYRLLREVIMGCEDEGLMKQLQEYEDLLRAKGETILYHCKKQKQMDNGLYMKLKAKHETKLATLMRIQDFLVNDIGLDDAIFTGFREGCIELYYKLPPETASISVGPLCSDVSRSKLLQLGVSRIELSGHWVIDTASGRVTYLKTPQNECLAEDSNSKLSADEATHYDSDNSAKITLESKFTQLLLPVLGSSPSTVAYEVITSAKSFGHQTYIGKGLSCQCEEDNQNDLMRYNVINMCPPSFKMSARKLQTWKEWNKNSPTSTGPSTVRSAMV